MKKYEFTTKKSVDSVIEQLKLNGIAHIPGYLKKNVITNLNAEFERLLTEKLPCTSAQTKHPINVDGRAARFNPWHSSADKEFATTTAVYKDPFMKEVSESYFSPHKYNLNEQVFITHELPSKVPILPWHIDRIQSLKFWFYLLDTTAKDGAFEYCPGTHWEGRYRAGYHMLRGVAVKDLPNDIQGMSIRNPVTVEANAGDLLIFDPDGFHRGSIVKPGGERRVMRGHTYPKEGRRYEDKRFTPGWWLSSRFNLAKKYEKHGTRILGDAVKDDTLNRNAY
ncbi:MAG: phytanoyl-CoA dioxygenase family protein [Leptospirales bacterium]